MVYLLMISMKRDIISSAQETQHQNSFHQRKTHWQSIYWEVTINVQYGKRLYNPMQTFHHHQVMVTK